MSGYTRSDGTHVAGYTRSSPSSSKSSSVASRDSVQVNGYRRSDGTYVEGYTRSAPLSSSVSNGSYSAHESKSSVSTTSSKPQGQKKCYVDNAYNRRLGRVGKPVGTHVVSKSSTTGEYVSHVGRNPKIVRQHTILEENQVNDLVVILQGLSFHNPDRRAYQSALDRLQREEVEESRRKEGITPCTSMGSHSTRELIPFDELQLQKEIGHGAFGVVYACKWRDVPVAYKKFVYQQMSKKLLDKFIAEVRILAHLSHPNIIKMFGVVAERGNIGIVMEFMLCSLFEAIFIDNTEFSGSNKKEIVSKVASALQYLHSREPKIAHCDIKSANILLDKDNNPKLCDFGLGAIKNATESSRSSVAAPPGQGTPRYSAPEVLRGELLNMDQLLQADIYSLTLVVYEVIAVEEPFEELSAKQLEENVGRGNLRPTSTSLSQPLSDFLNSCWNSSPSKRPTADKFCAMWEKIDL